MLNSFLAFKSDFLTGVAEVSAGVATCYPTIEKSSLDIRFVCDECCLPLDLYGENTIQSSVGSRIITRKLCDLHAQEILGEIYQ